MKEELLKRVKECPTLPSMPAIAMQVLELAQKADVDIPEIARVIQRDPALSGKILKTVNSSFYARSKNVSTVSQALVILGLQSVKTLALGFSLVANLSKSKGKGFSHLIYWKRSIFAATAARILAGKAGVVQQEESFLSALLQDIGMLVLDQVLGDAYGAAFAKAETHELLAEIESNTLGASHAEVGGWLTEMWKLPPLLTTPIQFHHNPLAVSDTTLKKVTEIVSIGGRCADVFIDKNPAAAIASVRASRAELLKFSEADTDAMLNQLGTQTKEVASLFEINIGATASYESILKRANETLIELTLQSQMQATQLKEQNIELKRVATTDALTGLSNRHSLDQFLGEQFNMSVANNGMLSLLLLDVDKFKSVNDTRGHQAGDQVLRELGKLLQQAVRPQDMAARYGGEEMCIILPDTSRATAAAVAESVRRAVANTPIELEDGKLVITVSIGVATYEPGCPLKTVAHLLKAADLSVYAAKNAGRNCVKIFSISPTNTKAA